MELEKELTEEQRKIVKMVVNKATNKEIANEMNFSLPSIKRRLTAIYELLGVEDRTDLRIQYNSMRES